MRLTLSEAMGAQIEEEFLPCQNGPQYLNSIYRPSEAHTFFNSLIIQKSLYLPSFTHKNASKVIKYHISLSSLRYAAYSGVVSYTLG